MTLIKMFFVRTITALGQEVAEKTLGKVRLPLRFCPCVVMDSAAQELQEAAQDTLLYAKFANIGARLRPLVYELEKRSLSEPQEYASLMAECYAAWFAVRNQLLAVPLAEEVRRMDPQNSELIKLVRPVRFCYLARCKPGIQARAGCNHLRGICLSEWNLFKDIFSTAGEDHI
jgi:hypothetical protein